MASKGNDSARARAITAGSFIADKKVTQKTELKQLYANAFTGMTSNSSHMVTAPTPVVGTGVGCVDGRMYGLKEYRLRGTVNGAGVTPFKSSLRVIVFKWHDSTQPELSDIVNIGALSTLATYAVKTSSLYTILHDEMILLPTTTWSTASVGYSLNMKPFDIVVKPKMTIEVLGGVATDKQLYALFLSGEAGVNVTYCSNILFTDV